MVGKYGNDPALHKFQVISSKRSEWALLVSERGCLPGLNVACECEYIALKMGIKNSA